MHRMTLMRRVQRVERGAVSTIVAALLGGGVVLGFAALSIDVGSMMWERRQLQNAADAAALSLAQTCAEKPADCNPATVAAGLDSLINANNFKDDQGDRNQVAFAGSGICGENLPAGASLESCESAATQPTGGLPDCPEVPSSLAAGAAYVEVHTQTRENGGSLLPAPLIRTISGNPGTTIGACARVAFGQPGGDSMLPITFSTCEWQFNTANGTDFHPFEPDGNPGYGSSPLPPWPAPAKEIRIVLQDPPNSGSPLVPTPCDNFNGHDVPGGFGYIENDGCAAVIDENDWARVRPGNNLTNQCDISGMLGKVVYLPVFNCTTNVQPTSSALPSNCNASDPTATENAGHGNNTWYHIEGYAKFYLSGYKLSGGTPVKVAGFGSTATCTGANRCIMGWFLDGILHDRPVGGPPAGPAGGYGTYAIQPAG